MFPHAFAPVAYQLQEGLRSVDLKSFDLKALVDKADVKTVGLVALAAVVVAVLVNLFVKSLVPLGKGLLSSAAHAWDNADQWGLNALRDSSQSMAPVTKVLDALSEAAKKWDEPEGDVRHRGF